MKWLISVAVAVAMVLGGVAMASPALALELPDPTLLEVPGVTLRDQFDGGNAPVFPSDDGQDIVDDGQDIVDDGQDIVDDDSVDRGRDQTVEPTPGDVELPDFTLPDQCGQDNAPVFASDEGQDIVDDGQDIVDDDSVADEPAVDGPAVDDGGDAVSNDAVAEF